MAHFTPALEPMLHLRFEGRGVEIPLAELDLTLESADSTVLRAVASHLGRSVETLRDLVVVRHERTIVVRPEAIYG